MILSRTELRALIRNKRLQLTDEEQIFASTSLVSQFSQLPEMSSVQHIALYLSVDGEIDTAPLIDWLWQRGKTIYLPVIHPFSAGHLLFLRYEPHTPLVLNRYKIKEPRLDVTEILPAHKLDIICTPLVAFDHNGHRLGMGGGYYDRTLEPWFKNQSGPKPIGLAHQCQKIDQLPIESWDVPLPKIVTPVELCDWE
ncbi:5-formyltetrahydrofolate cyclo-ligase [Vibrio ostreicida]|uniref:5-formyltetrahydrofolate cyclo-ligase n=1 Tax=Vibrio ostreicida TaxID=526588 RepID=A0ABT8BQ25_9VIBR|nr:5-formyltetrahydrofolate cyclo-ligase [Vibrio ostreicida]MDN3608200.1 5-formyltetrahydrofolate cyclo-ligase [Vibrio ostreicida]MDN3610974.1 5-formyltetrahydrofolate cyclo-ligase [Vibrio ostreicida]NPD10551.1 5-formyltetrahydrofolate cyclo-ligase [Vibrio ostreicida]